ncbi:MAG TPA: S41 family peptidase [Stellaceae bacterium]|nr:S41 family peptidase [Stellaceae bacterium]
MRAAARLVAILLLLGLAPQVAAQPTPPASSAVLDEVWRTVNERFYDPHFGGHDWAAIGDTYRDLARDTAPAALPDLINRMLGELGASHTAYLTADDAAYYDLADIFSGALRHELPRFFPNGEVSYVGIGALTQTRDGKVFVYGLPAGLPAARSGLKTGDEVVAADGAEFEPVKSFAGKEGQTVTLTIRRTAGGPTETLAVTPERIKPDEAYLAAIEASARIIAAEGRRIGYIRIWSYADRAYQRALEEAITSGPLKDADALIWDLRGGWGGAQPSYLDLFDPRGPAMTVIHRSGRTETVNARWRRPVVLLIDGGTRRGKEILAYGFKKYGFGPLVGTTTKGDVLAATAFMLSDGSLLELAVEDVRVDGERLEGHGVAPTIEVPFELEYSAGADPQLERALAVAAQSVHG